MIKATYSFSVALMALAVSAHSASITGTVVDHAGKPIAGASVTIRSFSSIWALPASVTDGQGHFTVDIPPGTSEPWGQALVHKAGAGLGSAVLAAEPVQITVDGGGSLSGLVVDSAGKPVAGAGVVLALLMRPGAGYVSLQALPVQSDYMVKSDAQGRWTIGDVWPDAMASVTVSDPRYVSVTARAKVTEGGAVTLVARPGATITGKLLSQDAKPVAGVHIFAQGQGMVPGWAQADTGADGSFSLSGLDTGKYNVIVDEGVRPWVVAADEGVVAKEGETVAAPDLKETAGAIVTGVVKDAATGAPLAHVGVGSYGPHRPTSSAAIIEAQTDAQGRYTLRVAPGKSSVYMCGPPADYLNSNDQTSVTLSLGEQKTADFALKAGLTLTGKLVDDTGKPVSGLPVSTTPTGPDSWQGGNQAQTDSDGKFSIKGLKPGEFQVAVTPEWEVVRGSTVTLPSKGPLIVTVKHVPLVTVKGLVRDTGGQGVPGAQVTATVFTPVTPTSSTSTDTLLTTDAAGEFTIHDIGARQSVTVRASKPGYVQAGGGAVTRAGDTLTVSPLVLAHLTETLTGLVTDAQGAPVAGALVDAPRYGQAAPVVTAKDGRFTLTGLPPADVSIVAAKGLSSAMVTAKAGEPVKLALQPNVPEPPKNVGLAKTILTALSKDPEAKDYYARGAASNDLAPYDPEAALTLTRDTSGAASQSGVSSIIATLAEVNPSLALTWGVPHLSWLRDNASRKSATLQLALAAVPTDLALATRLYKEATISSLPAPESMGTLFQLGLQAGVAGRLKLPEAADLAQQAGNMTVRLMAKMPEENGRSPKDEMLAAVAEGIAQGDGVTAELLVPLISPRNQPNARAKIVEQTADYDVRTAQRVLGMIPSAGEDSFYYSMAAQYVARALARTLPEKALALARGIPQDNFRAMALSQVADALPAAAAGPVYREAFKAALTVHNAAATIVANAAARHVPAVGSELLAQAKSLVLAETNEEPGIWRGVSSFAFYNASANPAESRILLEREYARVSGASHQGWEQVGPTLAMAAVDVDRALEMAKAIPDTNARLDAQRKIAQYVIAPAKVRQTLRFDRWTASDTWIPGTPTGW